jgi:LmbE family N-acetylglucosaminyl deacetylase
MRVLAIGAHPDDVETLCSGTLALCKERGDEIFIAIATNGNVGTGDPSITREQIGRTRHEEAKASVAHLDATLIIIKNLERDLLMLFARRAQMSCLL